VEVAQNIPAGRVFVDGKGVGDVDKPVLRDRRHLSEDGMVLAVVVVDRKTGELLAPPDIISRGFIQEKERDNLLEYAKCVVLEVLEEVEIGPAVNWSEVSERIKRELRRFFNTVVERRPVILPVVVPM
jgi:ribonuclease J